MRKSTCLWLVLLLISCSGPGQPAEESEQLPNPETAVVEDAYAPDQPTPESKAETSVIEDSQAEVEETDPETTHQKIIWEGPDREVQLALERLYPGSELLDLAWKKDEENKHWAGVIGQLCSPQDQISGHSQCRILLFGQGTEETAVEILQENHQLIGCSDCGGAGVGDPFMGIYWEESTLIVPVFYGSCVKSQEEYFFGFIPETNELVFDSLRIYIADCRTMDTEGERTQFVSGAEFGSVPLSEFDPWAAQRWLREKAEPDSSR